MLLSYFYKLQDPEHSKKSVIKLYKFHYLREPLDLRSVIKGVLIFSFRDLIKHVLYNIINI